MGTLILNLILLAGITISIFAVDRFGRRTLLLIGAGGCAACDIAFGGIGQLGINEKAGNVVMSIACIWVVFYAGSLATVGWGYLGEVSSLTLRSKTIAFATVLQSCMAMLFVSGNRHDDRVAQLTRCHLRSNSRYQSSFLLRKPTGVYELIGQDSTMHHLATVLILPTRAVARRIYVWWTHHHRNGHCLLLCSRGKSS